MLQLDYDNLFYALHHIIYKKYHYNTDNIPQNIKSYLCRKFDMLNN
jgi:hypothetical protein